MLRNYFYIKTVKGKDGKKDKLYLRYAPYFIDPVTGENGQQDFTTPIKKIGDITKKEYAICEKKYAEHLEKRKIEAANAQKTANIETAVSKMIDKYMELHLQPPGHKIKQRTYNGYCDYINAWVKPIIGHMQVTDIKTDDVQLIWNKMAEAGRAEATKKQICNLLRGFFDNLIDNYVIDRSPITSKMKFTAKKPNPNPPTIEEVDAVFAKMKKKSTPLIYLASFIAAHTGMRRSEIAGIVLEHWDAEKGIITMVKSVSTVDGRENPQSFNEGKTEDSLRTLGVDAEVVKEINDYIDANRLILHPKDKLTYLFQDEHGNYLNPNRLSDGYRAMARRMKIKADKGFKNLRHHHGSVLKLVTSIDVIKDRLGHSLSSTTEKYYLKDMRDKTINDGTGDIYLQALRKRRETK